MPLQISGPIGYDQLLACGFCETVAPGREFVRDQGWPPVNLVARLGR